MKIIILGGGQVGGSLAEILANENHDVTLVDIDDRKLNEFQDRLDIRTVLGNASYPNVLTEAGADGADMIIAVTSSDEVNMVACQVAHSLFHTPTKIARIRSQHYFERKELFGKENLPIDVFISPERLVTQYMQQLIAHPGALQVLDFAEGRVKLVAVKPYYGGPLLGKSIKMLRDYLPGVETRVAAIFRNDKSIALDGSTEIEIGDEVFFITASENAHVIMAALRRAEEPYRRIMIAGGGNVGSQLAAVLENDYEVKLIDWNHDRCQRIANEMSNTTVLCGDVCDKQLLTNENIEHVDVFCAVTSDDEDNIIACLQAKRLGAKQVMVLITRTAYVDLIEGGPINIAISPQQATIGSILTHIRQGDVVNVHSLRRGAAEAIEAVAHGDYKNSKVVGRNLKEIKLPKGTTIGAIVRGDEVIIPHHDTVIEPEDHVIMFVSEKRFIRDVEKLFQVSPEFF
ncbi:MAG: Trk system potassium transporter TrkA [Coxiellaceae bacterium]|nr:Trk system potassium transporter TrkA [Coxiellaceae bacterium]